MSTIHPWLGLWIIKIWHGFTSNLFPIGNEFHSCLLLVESWWIISNFHVTVKWKLSINITYLPFFLTYTIIISDWQCHCYWELRKQSEQARHCQWSLQGDRGRSCWPALPGPRPAPALLHLVQGEPGDGGPGAALRLALSLPPALGPQHCGGQRGGQWPLHLQGAQQGQPQPGIVTGYLTPLIQLISKGISCIRGGFSILFYNPWLELQHCFTTLENVSTLILNLLLFLYQRSGCSQTQFWGSIVMTFLILIKVMQPVITAPWPMIPTFNLFISVHIIQVS